jgi:hypothetical protein
MAALRKRFKFFKSVLVEQQTQASTLTHGGQALAASETNCGDAALAKLS